ESPVTDVDWIEGTRKNNLRYRNSARAGNRHLPVRCDVERLAVLQELVERLHESRMDSVREIAFSLFDDLKCVMSIFGRAQIVEGSRPQAQKRQSRLHKPTRDTRPTT